MNREIDMPNIIRGYWQLAEDHSQQKKTIQPILDAIECGFTTFDCGDIYLGVEELLGQALKANRSKKLRIHTKFVPDIDQLHRIDKAYVENIIDRSLKRLQVDCIDLVQFHWWDWEVKNYLHTMECLSELKVKGKITEIGLTNTNTYYLEEITARFNISSLQTQVSLFDKRVKRGIESVCREKKIQIFAYGSLLGGFLSEKWLKKEAPDLNLLKNRSLIKYKLLIDAACGWKEFQKRLEILNKLAIKHHSTIANVAIAALIQSNQADSIIVGLSPHNYFVQNRNLMALPLLEEEEIRKMQLWSCHLQGDVYDEEREKNGIHAKVMNYHLNAN